MKSKRSRGAKYNYIKIVGEEPIAAAVLESKCGLLSMPPKKVRDDTHKTTNLFEKVKSMFYIYECKIQNIILQYCFINFDFLNSFFKE